MRSEAEPELIFVDGWSEILRHMLGAGDDIPKSRRGYRNRYCSAVDGDAHKTLEVMEANGLVERGQLINDGTAQMWGATRKGCTYINLGRAATKRAMSP